MTARAAIHRPVLQRPARRRVPPPTALLALLLLFAPATPAPAQESRIVAPQLHTWYNYFGNHALTRRWGLHLEGQFRRDGLGQRAMQSLWRPGVQLYLSPNVTLTGGYAYVYTHRYGDYPVAAAFPEHRIWQQALVRQQLGDRAVLQHRYRLEQRNIGQMEVRPGFEPSRVSWRYENRFRYMARVDLPLTRKANRPDLYIAAYGEFFLNFGRNVAANVFDQNRAYLALGKALGPSARFEVGYMNQLLQQRNGRIFEANHTLMLSVSSTLRFRK